MVVIAAVCVVNHHPSTRDDFGTTKRNASIDETTSSESVLGLPGVPLVSMKALSILWFIASLTTCIVAEVIDDDQLLWVGWLFLAYWLWGPPTREAPSSWLERQPERRA
jgi:hypothetical protein